MKRWAPFWGVCRFELVTRLRAPSTWVLFALLALKTFTDFLSAQWDALIGGGSVARNSPYAAYLIFIFCAFWSATLGAGLMTAPLLRDLRFRTAPLVYATPIGDRSYFLAKYVAALLMFLLVLAGIYVGYALVHPLGHALALVPPQELMPTPWAQSLHAFALGTGFAVVVWGTLHFCMAAWTGRPAASYVLAATLLMVFIVIEAVFHESPETRMITQIIDPLGKAAFDSQAAYWSQAERNSHFISLSGTLLANRLLYLAITATVLAVTVWRFERRTFLSRTRRRGRVVDESAIEAVAGDGPVRTLPPADLAAARDQFRMRQAVRVGWQQFILVTRELTVRAAFVMIVLLSATAAGDMGGYYTPLTGRLLPLSIVALPNIAITLYFPALLLVLFFAADIVSRDRTTRMAALVDACPAPVATRLIAHLVAVGCFASTVALLPVVALLLVQLPAGILDPDPLTAVRASALTLGPAFATCAMLPVVWYAVTASRSAAQGLGIISALTPIILHEIGAVDRHLLLFGVPFETSYSGFDIGTMALRRQLFGWVYWAGCGAVLAIGAYWLWPHGVETSWAARRRQLGLRVGRASTAIVVAGALVIATAGAWLYYQTEILGAYEPDRVAEADDAAYERRYAAAADIPQPTIVDARLNVDLTAGAHAATIRGVYRVTNAATQAITLLHVNIPTHQTLRNMRWNDEPVPSALRDDALGHHVYRLSRALSPGGQAMLTFEAELAYHGFSNDGPHGTLTEGATVMTHEMLPSFGYDRSRELRMPGLRRRQGLNGRAVLPPAEAAATGIDRAGSNDADAAIVEIMVRVPTDHTAVAPGLLIDLRDEGSSRVFRFRTERPLRWNIAIASAPLRRLDDRWKPGGDQREVGIEVLFHPKHGWNAKRVVEASKAALDAYSSAYGPYPYSSVRVAEVPYGFTETTSSGNLILIPERDAWLHDYRTDPPLDWIQFVIGRELAKTWWGELLPAADVRGARLLTEGLPAYDALSLLEARRDSEQAKRYLRVVADEYLRRRVAEGVDEPAVLDLDDHSYAQHKSLLALVAARELIGPARMEHALSRFWSAHARRGPPYIGARVLVDALASAADHGMRSRVLSLFTDVEPADLATTFGEP